MLLYFRRTALARSDRTLDSQNSGAVRTLQCRAACTP